MLAQVTADPTMEYYERGREDAACLCLDLKIDGKEITGWYYFNPLETGTPDFSAGETVDFNGDFEDEDNLIISSYRRVRTG